MSDWRPRRNGDVWVKQQGEETAVYDNETGRLHLLNATALAIWEACDGETSVDELIEAVAELTMLDHERALAEVDRALRELRSAGLVS